MRPWCNTAFGRAQPEMIKKSANSYIGAEEFTKFDIRVIFFTTKVLTDSIILGID
jgi:hypothetical protein